MSIIWCFAYLYGCLHMKLLVTNFENSVRNNVWYNNLIVLWLVTRQRLPISGLWVSNCKLLWRQNVLLCAIKSQLHSPQWCCCFLIETQNTLRSVRQCIKWRWWNQKLFTHSCCTIPCFVVQLLHCHRSTVPVMLYIWKQSQRSLRLFWHWSYTMLGQN